MKKLTVYVKKTCRTCAKFVQEAETRGLTLEVVEFVDRPVLTEAALADLLHRAGRRPGEVLRKRDKHYKALGLDRSLPPDEELIRLMVRHPGLLQRPIVDDGRRVRIRPRVDEVLAGDETP